MVVEICANSFESASNAQKAGADRIELCSELSLGGVSPSYGLLKQVTKKLDISVHVLIRPRSGNFTYSKDEFEIMLQDIKLCKELGCAGIVSGILHANNSIDFERTKQLIEATRPMKFVFHRAFDWVEEPLEVLKQLEGLGVDAILTSGQRTNVGEGFELLNELNKAATKLVIMPGGGVNKSNIHLFKENDFKAIHFSASERIEILDENPSLKMYSQPLPDGIITQSSFTKIQKIIEQLKQ